MTDEQFQAMPQDEPMMMEPQNSFEEGNSSMSSVEESAVVREIETYEAEMAAIERSGTPAMPYEPASGEASPFLAESNATAKMAANNESTSAAIEASNYQEEQSAVSAEMTENANTEAAYQQSDNAFDQSILD